VFCSNKEKGCQWQGEVNNITHHLENSDSYCSSEVKCPNDCGKLLQQQYLIVHIENECVRRKAQCQYCYITGEHRFVTNEHMGQCPKLPVPCPNSCEVGIIARGDIEQHKKICPLELIQCEYGCVEKMARKDQKIHYKEKTEEHLLLNKHELDATKKELAKLQRKVTEIETAAQKKLTELEQKLQQMMFEPPMMWHTYLNYKAAQLSSAQPLVPVIIKVSTRRGQATVQSDPFYTHHQGYRLSLGVRVNWRSNHLSLWIQITKGPYDDFLKWPLKGQCEVKLLNQTSNSEHYLGTGKYQVNGHMRPTGGEKNLANMWCNPHFITNGNLCRNTFTCQYIKDDAIFIQVDYKLDQ